MKRALLILGLLCSSLTIGLSQTVAKRPIMIFIPAGQSNMDGCGIVEELPKKYETHPEWVTVWQKRIHMFLLLKPTD